MEQGFILKIILRSLALSLVNLTQTLLFVHIYLLLYPRYQIDSHKCLDVIRGGALLLLDLELRDPQHFQLEHELVVHARDRIVDNFLEVHREFQLHLIEVLDVQGQKVRLFEGLHRETPHDVLVVIHSFHQTHIDNALV